jgi:short-subunit dehydrogenase
VTEFHSRLGADFTKEQKKWLKPEEVVDISLSALEKAQVLCIPGFRRRLIVKFIRVLPRRIYYKMMNAIGQKTKKKWDEIEKS